VSNDDLWLLEDGAVTKFRRTHVLAEEDLRRAIESKPVIPGDLIIIGR
jgi:hypothetical protein